MYRGKNFSSEVKISSCLARQPRHRAKATEQMVIRPNGRKLSPPESHFRGPFELKIVLLSPTNSSKILAKTGEHRAKSKQSGIEYLENPWSGRYNTIPQGEIKWVVKLQENVAWGSRKSWLRKKEGFHDFEREARQQSKRKPGGVKNEEKSKEKANK